jgi:hypothetical protein
MHEGNAKRGGRRHPPLAGKRQRAGFFLRFEFGRLALAARCRSKPAGGVIVSVSLFQTVAFFDFFVREPGFIVVANAGLDQIQEIVQILQFLAQRCDLLALAANGPHNSLLNGLSHKYLFDFRFCESQ